jgi:hypothetical protein
VVYSFSISKQNVFTHFSFSLRVLLALQPHPWLYRPNDIIKLAEDYILLSLRSKYSQQHFIKHPESVSTLRTPAEQFTTQHQNSKLHIYVYPYYLHNNPDSTEHTSRLSLTFSTKYIPDHDNSNLPGFTRGCSNILIITKTAYW